jgi:hypothetical protein
MSDCCMSAQQMEQRLVELAQTYQRTRDPAVRAEYRALHAKWIAAKP